MKKEINESVVMSDNGSKALNAIDQENTSSNQQANVKGGWLHDPDFITLVLVVAAIIYPPMAVAAVLSFIYKIYKEDSKNEEN